MAKYKRWTKLEDEILVRALKANPHNKHEAFRQAALKLEDRDEISCSNRWYGCLSNEYSKHYVGALFTLVGSTSRLDNRTVTRENTHINPVKHHISIWTKLKKLLGLK